MVRTACLLALGAGLAAFGWCGSTVASFTGQVEIDTPPGSLIPGATENDLKDMLFMEQTDLSFASNITVDATQPGLYTSVAGLTPGVILAGTAISDTYFHSDPLTPDTRFSGSITFTSPILGVIAKSRTLTGTDSILAAPGVAYAATDLARGFELSPQQDEFTISADLLTLTFSVTTWGNVDDLRIITVGQSLTPIASDLKTTPEPGTLALLCLGFATAWLYKKRSGEFSAPAV